MLPLECAMAVLNGRRKVRALPVIMEGCRLTDVRLCHLPNDPIAALEYLKSQPSHTAKLLRQPHTDLQLTQAQIADQRRERWLEHAALTLARLKNNAAKPTPPCTAKHALTLLCESVGVTFEVSRLTSGRLSIEIDDLCFDSYIKALEYVACRQRTHRPGRNDRQGLVW